MNIEENPSKFQDTIKNEGK